jgi:putative ABC transport system permease protein
MRGTLAACRDIVESLASRPGRVALALLALFTGAFALAVQAGVLRGLEARAQRIAADFGLDAFAILPGGASVDTRDLPREAVRRLQAVAPRLIAAGVRGSRANTRAGDLTLHVTAIDPALGTIRPFRLRAGRLLDPLDNLARARVAVLSTSLAGRQGWDVGATLYLGAEPFEVVGIADFPGTSGPADALFGEANGVLVPLDTPGYWLQGDPPGDRVQAIWVQHGQDLSPTAAVEWTRHLLADGTFKENAFTWLTADTLQAQVRRWQRLIRLTAGSIAFFCLLLGGTTLMSLMVANVQERVGEIGLRRSLGATRGAIARLFMGEALVLTSLAAGAGAALAAPLGRLPWLRAADLPFAYDAHTAAVPLLASLGLGVLFSLAPAWRAARIEPAEALRGE